MTPTLKPGLIRALAFLDGALAAAFVRAALNAQQAREEPHGDSTGDNGTRNETQRRPPLRPAPRPHAIERQNPSEGFREKMPVEEVEDERRGSRKNMVILMVMLAMQVITTVMMMLQIGSETNITTLLELSLSIGIILYIWFSIFLGFR